MLKNPIQAIAGLIPLPFQLDMSDDALVTFTGPATPTATGAAFALSFQDNGFMPVTALTIAGLSQDLKNSFGGMFIRYSGQGTQNFAAPNAPTTADYSGLHFDLMGYQGNAVFGHAANGTPTVSGVTAMTQIAQGDLIANMGHLAFNPATGGIAGTLSTTFKVAGLAIGTLDVSVMHAAGDVGALPAGNGFTLSGGNIHATFHA